MILKAVAALLWAAHVVAQTTPAPTPSPAAPITTPAPTATENLCYGTGECTLSEDVYPFSYFTLTINNQCIEYDPACVVSVVNCAIVPALPNCRACYASCDAATKYLDKAVSQDTGAINFCSFSDVYDHSYCDVCSDSSRCAPTPAPTPAPTAADGATRRPTAQPTPAPTSASVAAVIIGTLTLPTDVLQSAGGRRLLKMDGAGSLRRRGRLLTARERRLEATTLEKALAAFFKVDTGNAFRVDNITDPSQYFTNLLETGSTSSDSAGASTTDVDFVIAYYDPDAQAQAAATLAWLETRPSWVAFAALLATLPEDVAIKKISNAITSANPSITWDGPLTAPAATDGSSSSSDNGAGTNTGGSGSGSSSSGGKNSWWKYVVAVCGGLGFLLLLIGAGLLFGKRVRRQKTAHDPHSDDLPIGKGVSPVLASGGGIRALQDHRDAEDGDFTGEESKTPQQLDASEGYVSAPDYPAPLAHDSAVGASSESGSDDLPPLGLALAGGAAGAAMATGGADESLAASSAGNSPTGTRASVFDSRTGSNRTFKLQGWSPSSRAASGAGFWARTGSALSRSSNNSDGASPSRRRNNNGPNSPSESVDSAWQRAWMAGRTLAHRFEGGGVRTPRAGALERARADAAAPWK